MLTYLTFKFLLKLEPTTGKDLNLLNQPLIINLHFKKGYQ